jgi:hypothetical protein
MFRLLANDVSADPATLDTASANITTGAWVQFVASLSAGTSAIQFTNGSDKVLRLGVGAAAAEVDSGIYIAPGVGVLLPKNLKKGVRLSLRALGGTASSGLVTANFFG